MHTIALGCLDTFININGYRNTDLFGNGCDYYDGNPRHCGMYDNTNFFASTMCCACKTGNLRTDKIQT